MIKWIVILLVVSVIASALGYRGVAGTTSRLASFLIAAVLVVVVVVLLLFGWAGGGVW